MNITPPSTSEKKLSKTRVKEGDKLETICSTEIWVDVQQTTQRYIPEDSTLCIYFTGIDIQHFKELKLCISNILNVHILELFITKM